MMSNPEKVARARYSQSFQSQIFEPLPRQSPALQPAGKRRDQTSHELFGSINDKEGLRSCPKTFQPKEDELTAHEKKHQFLASHMSQSPRKADRNPPRPVSEAGFVQPAQAGFNPYQEEQAVDANVKRQEELKSKLFGRETPATAPQSDQRSSRLTPNDFNWHSFPEHRSPRQMSHTDRAYKEKCSEMFDRRSPQIAGIWRETQRQLQEEEISGDAKRKENVYYSDLFGRSAEPQQSGAPARDGAQTHRPRIQSTAEQKITVHQDWTDPKTELMHSRESRAEHAYQRKSEELHKTRIFGETRQAWEPVERLSAVTHDNSDKLRSARGKGTQQLHQAHLRTSVTPNAFYEEAENAKQWQVAEVHLSGLGANANDEYVRGLCQGTDLQLVKVATEVDPVRNLCKGRAKVTVRYNPQRDNVNDLVRKFEDSNLKVEV